MSKISKKIPEWRNFITKGLNYDRSETFRTLRHIFRSLWVYYAIINDEFDVDISNENISFLKNILNKIYIYNSEIFPLLLLFHDLGRPMNREWHTFESANLLKQNNLLVKLQLNLKQQMILYGAIKYHLIPGTIYTGESSYYGAISIFEDKELSPLWQSQEDINIYFDILTAFTIIDIWGYDYSKIYDHYFENYNNIRSNLSSIFNKTKSFNFEDRKRAISNALSGLDRDNLKWRICCALRIFQFINTRPNLTDELYYSKVDEALKSIGIDWKEFVASLKNQHSIIQFKYALPLMMILASSSFKREPINNEEKLDPKLFYFWQSCCEKVFLYLENHKSRKLPLLWNFNFKLPRGWFFKKEYIEFVRSEKFLTDLRNIKPIYDSKFDSFHVNYKLNI